MNYTDYLARTICDKLAAGSSAVLASIVSQQGSTPRNTGTKMVIGEGEKGFGTIGGGLLESNAIQESAKLIALKKSAFLELELDGSAVESKEMICGGKILLLLDFIEPTDENREVFQSFKDGVSSRSDFHLATYFAGPDDNLQQVGRAVFFPEGKMVGSSPLSTPDNERLKSQIRNISNVETLTFEDIRVVVERIQKLKTLFCFGAGHVAVPTAHIASMVGFRVVVLDDRSEFASVERFPDAYSVRVIKDFEHAFEDLDIDSDSSIVILTRGHQFDRIVLEQALQTKAGYIGMISSSKKKQAIYSALVSKGFTEQELARVHAPIGIAVGAQSPEEIAVSIVAELISLNHGKTN